MFTKRTRTLLLIACSLLWMAIGTEAVERKLLQTNPGETNQTVGGISPTNLLHFNLAAPLQAENMP